MISSARLDNTSVAQEGGFMRVMNVSVEFDGNRKISLNPRTGVDLAGVEKLYPKEVEFLLDLIKLLKEYKDSFSKGTESSGDDP